jgi:hypothetical protein
MTKESSGKAFTELKCVQLQEVSLGGRLHRYIVQLGSSRELELKSDGVRGVR